MFVYCFFKIYENKIIYIIYPQLFKQLFFNNSEANGNYLERKRVLKSIENRSRCIW